MAPEAGVEAMVAEPDHAVGRTRELFLDEANTWGCAETAFIVLKEAFGLPDSEDAAPAMALNGGLAYSGGPCGAMTGAALAVGLLAARRISDHRLAKRAARRITARLLEDFEIEHGALNCRDLLGLDLRTEDQHAAFIASGIWRDRCMRQVEFTVRRLAPLASEVAWRQALSALEHPEP
jgi:C_GCAxxG_C_C family probable redox protein